VDWRSDRAFETAACSEYLRPDDEVLVDMRDECDLRLTVKRGPNLIQVFACAKFRSVTVVVAGRDEESVDACGGDHRALFEVPTDNTEPDQPSAKFAFWYLGEKRPEREDVVAEKTTLERVRLDSPPKSLLPILVRPFGPGAERN
jgi:hypothetical protein